MKKHRGVLKDYLKIHRLDIAVAVCFFIYAVFMTWPFIVSPTTTLTAPLAGDVSSSVTKFDSIKQESKNPFLDWHLKTIAAPEGITTNTSVDRVSFFSTLYLWVFTLLFSSIIAHGLFTFLGYFLTGFITYLFLKKVFKNRIISFIGGLAYAAFPLFISLARAAPIYIHMWLYILPLWAFYSLWQKYSTKRLVVAIISILPAMFWTPYFTFHILLVAGSVLLVYAFYLLKSFGIVRTLHLLSVIIASWISFIGIYYLVGMSTPQGGAPERTIQEIYDQSLHPLMLVLPGAFSWWGQNGYDLLYKLIPRAFDTNLYAGISTLLLAVLGIVSLFHKNLRKNLSDPIVLVGFFAIMIVIVTFLFSLAPTIGVFGINIPTPNAIIAHVMPALRAGQRLAMPMMLGFIILAMIGLYVLLIYIKNARNKYLIVAIIACVLLLDLSSRPPLLTSHLPQSDTAEVLSKLPDGTVVQYINGSITGDPGQIPCQLRLIHQKTIVNFCGLEIDYPKGHLQPLHKLALLDLEQQVAQYQTIGVRYVIVENTDRKILQQIATMPQVFTKVVSDERFQLFELTY